MHNYWFWLFHEHGLFMDTISINAPYSSISRIEVSKLIWKPYGYGYPDEYGCSYGCGYLYKYGYPFGYEFSLVMDIFGFGTLFIDLPIIRYAGR